MLYDFHFALPLSLSAAYGGGVCTNAFDKFIYCGWVSLHSIDK